MQETNFVEAWSKLINVPYTPCPPADCFSSGNAALMLRQFVTGRGNANYRQSMDMQRTFYLLRQFAMSQQHKPVFLVICDVGSQFEVWTAFDGYYGGYGARKRLKWDKWSNHIGWFHTAFTDAQSLNPAKENARVTKEVAESLSQVAQYLESQGHDPEEIALFLTRFALTSMLSQFGWLPNVPN